LSGRGSGRPSLLAPAPVRPVAPAERAPSFSILIPTYQAAETVAEAVRSALEQVVPAHEVIVIDDGSTDALEQALAPFTGRIRVLRKPNGGVSSALNAGAAVATGDFVAILDSDDVYHPRRIESLAAAAQLRPDLDLITTDARFIVAGEAVGRFSTANPFATEDQRRAIFESCFVGGWPAIRLSRLRSVGGFDESMRTGADWDCWIRIILAGGAAGLVEEPYYDYRLHGGSLTGSRISSLWDRVALLEKTTANPALRPDERTDLLRSLDVQRSRAVLAEVRAGLGGSVERGRLLRLALHRGISPRARLAALLAAVAPPLARRLIPAERPPAQRSAGDIA
jgi:GT2 family glycosyltransferase